jgi:hypothetical protein
LQSKNIKYSDLPLLHNELERKAKETIYQRRTKNTPVDQLRRMLEGYYVQLKTVAIKISKEAGNLFSSIQEILVFKQYLYTFRKLEDSD